MSNLRKFSSALLISFVFMFFLSPCGGGGGVSADDSGPAAGIMSVDQNALSVQAVSSTVLYAAFPGYGLWVYNGSTWYQLTPDTPQGMAVAGSILYGDFGGLGLWKYNGSAWSQLTPDNPENICASGSDLYGDFGALGLWKYNGTNWSQLTPDNPQTIAVSGSTLYGGFGGLGLWKYNGTSWSWLTSDSPQNIVASGSILYGDFGAMGLWKYGGTSWSLLTGDNPENIAASGSILYGDFGSVGLWKYDGTNWSQLTSDNPENIAASGSILYGDFGSLGLWKYDGTSWSQLTPDNPSVLATSITDSTGVSFSTTDLAGNYNIIGMSTGGINEGTVTGDVSIDSSGDIVSGTYYHSTGASASLTGGSLSLNTSGVLSGYIDTNVGIISTIQYGKLNPSKSFASFTSLTNLGERDLVTVLRKGNGFSQSDLTGVSYIYEMYVGGLNESYNSATITVDNNGSFLYGNLSVNGEGIVTGSGSGSGFTFSLYGAMDLSKEFAVSKNTYSNGMKSLVVTIKEGGTFSHSDLSGKWHASFASTGTEASTSYGVVELNSSGQVVGGFFNDDGPNVALTGGYFSITSTGVISGTLNGANGMVTTIASGKMNQSKNMMCLVGNDNGGGIDLMIVHKEN